MRTLHTSRTRSLIKIVAGGILALSAASGALSVPKANASVYDQPYPTQLDYKAHVKDLGWLPYVGPGETAGTVGQSRQAEAFSFELGYKGYYLGPGAIICQ